MVRKCFNNYQNSPSSSNVRPILERLSLAMFSHSLDLQGNREREQGVIGRASGSRYMARLRAKELIGV